MKTTLIAATTPFIPHKSEPRFLTAEELIVYCARVSNPSNQNNVETGEKLLRYCIKNGHWSVFETVSFTAEVETSLAIAVQILRHKSCSFQQFSMRYSEASKLSGDIIEPVQLRLVAAGGNRQGSGEEIHEDDPRQAKFNEGVQRAVELYLELLEDGVAPESARMILPMCSKTKLYFTGSVRSWIHYFEQRCSPHAQKEHRLIAEEIRDTHFKQVFPSIHEIITTKP